MAKSIVTPEAIISYPQIFTAKAYEEGDDPEFSAAFVFLKDTDISELKAAALAAAVERWGGGKIKALAASNQYFSPFRDNGEEKKGYPEGSTYFTARSKRKPGVVSQIPDANGKPTFITDEEQIVAGARVKVLVSVFTYDVKGNKGVSFGLEGVQLIREPTSEERLDNRVAAEDAFAVDLDAVADLSDLEGPSEGVLASDGADDLSDLM